MRRADTIKAGHGTQLAAPITNAVTQFPCSDRISAYWKRRFNREMFCYGEKAYVIIAAPRTNWPAARHSSPKPDKGRRVTPIGAGLLREGKPAGAWAGKGRG